MIVRWEDLKILDHQKWTPAGAKCSRQEKGLSIRHH